MILAELVYVVICLYVFLPVQGRAGRPSLPSSNSSTIRIRFGTDRRNHEVASLYEYENILMKPKRMYTKFTLLLIASI